jgi:hypothetical protein
MVVNCGYKIRANVVVEAAINCCNVVLDYLTPTTIIQM